MPNYHPLNTTIWLERPDRTESIGLIHLPTSAKTTQSEGYIVAMGSECHKQRAGIGDYVLYASYADPEYYEDPETGEEYTVIQESEILAYEKGSDNE